MLAQIAQPSNKEVVELLKSTLSGTPDAARAEPFTWIIALLVACLVVVGATFVWKLIRDFMKFIEGQQDLQREMQTECHTLSRESLQTVAAASTKTESALNAHAASIHKNTNVLERVIVKLDGGMGS